MSALATLAVRRGGRDDELIARDRIIITRICAQAAPGAARSPPRQRA